MSKSTPNSLKSSMKAWRAEATNALLARSALPRVHLNRRTVRVGCAMKVDVLSEQPLGSDGDVRLDVLDKVADVQLSVGVG